MTHTFSIVNGGMSLLRLHNSEGDRVDLFLQQWQRAADLQRNRAAAHFFLDGKEQGMFPWQHLVPGQACICAEAQGDNEVSLPNADS